MRKFAQQLRDNSLTLVVTLMLLAALAGQAVAGLADYNEQARTAGLAEITLGRYLTSSSFAVDVAENWQSEYLQFTLFILLTVWLVQRGSSETKAPGEEGLQSPPSEAGSGKEYEMPVFSLRKSPVSLTVTMAVIFIGSWVAQAVTGNVALNEERLRDLLDPLSLGAYLVHPDFWSRTLQNWQSELLAVGSMAIFTVFLRQKGSPESKPVNAPDEDNAG